MQVIFTHPVAIRMALFCDICNVHCASLRKDVQIGAASFRSDRPMAIPQVVPASTFRKLFLLLTFAFMLIACAVKRSRLSKVTLKILWNRTVGMMLSSTLTFSVLLPFFGHQGHKVVGYISTGLIYV